MKILAAIVIPPHLSASGAVNAAMAISRSLMRHCQVDVAIMSDRTRQQDREGLRIFERKATTPIDFTRGWLPNKYRTLFYRSDIGTMVADYDLVHLHNPIPALELRRIARACLSNNTPYVLTTHGFVEVLGMQSAYQLNVWQALVGRWCMTRPLRDVIGLASHICCLSPHDRMLLENLEVSPERLSVIPNGVSASFYAEPSREEVARTCAAFGLPLDKNPQVPVCFFLANHTRNKGLDILLDAFTQTQRPYLLVVGGKKRDYDYESYVDRARAGQRIVFTDALTDHQIRCLHHYADLFVFPSRADTLPLVVLEAMAAGKPVLSTRVGGIPYQVDDRCGRLVEPDNPTALRLALEELAADPNRLAEMGRAALAKVQAEFDWQRSADLTWEVYQRVMKSRLRAG